MKREQAQALKRPSNLSLAPFLVNSITNKNTAMGTKSEEPGLYHRGLGLCDAPSLLSSTPIGHYSDTTVVTTTILSESSVSSATFAATNFGSGADEHLPKKTARKRTRLSRRALSTVLNTDVHNFRAIVQHLTGGPPASFFRGLRGGSGLSVGCEVHPHHQSTNSLAPSNVNHQRQQEVTGVVVSDDSGNMTNNRACRGLQLPKPYN